MPMTIPNTAQFDVATAALEHLELLNRSNQNPLEIAAQFRTLLRSKKPHSSDTDYTYTDYISADATLRRLGRSYNLTNQRSKSLSKIQYELNDDHSLPDSCSSHHLSKCSNVISSTEDMCVDSGVSSMSSELTNLPHSSSPNLTSTRSQYPTINWKQIREKQNEQKLSQIKQLISTTFKSIRLAQPDTTNFIRISSAQISEQINSSSNPSKLRKSFQENIRRNNCLSQNRSGSSSSTSIRTPSISPVNCPRPTYTISRLNSTPIIHNGGDILVPIADCNLVIQHKAYERRKRMSHVEKPHNENELFSDNSVETVYI